MTLNHETIPEGRRHNLGLAAPPTSANASLWLSRYMPKHPSARTQPTAKAQLVYEVSSLHQGASSDLYRGAYARWKNTMERSGAGLAKLTTLTPVIVGLSADSLLESHLTLDHTYGVPVLPGTALKGLASQYAHLHLEEHEWRVQGEWHRRAFGTVPHSRGNDELSSGTFSKGEVTFHTALPEPGTYKLRAEILTVHHPDYYGGENVPPADWDSPTPVPLLSALGTFTLAMHCQDAELGREVFNILKLALDRTGFGAKTSSGYGQFRVTGDAFPTPMPPAALADALRSVQFLKRNDIVRKTPDLANRLNRLIQELGSPDAAPFRAEVIRDALMHLRSFATDRDTWREIRRSPWYKTLDDTYGVPEL